MLHHDLPLSTLHVGGNIHVMLQDLVAPMQPRECLRMRMVRNWARTKNKEL